MVCVHSGSAWASISLLPAVFLADCPPLYLSIWPCICLAIHLSAASLGLFCFCFVFVAGVDGCVVLLVVQTRLPFNASQQDVIATTCAAIAEPYLHPRISLLQGPPGTGKTHMVVGLVASVLKASLLQSGISAVTSSQMCWRDCNLCFAQS